MFALPSANSGLFSPMPSDTDWAGPVTGANRIGNWRPVRLARTMTSATAEWHSAAARIKQKPVLNMHHYYRIGPESARMLHSSDNAGFGPIVQKHWRKRGGLRTNVF